MNKVGHRASFTSSCMAHVSAFVRIKGMASHGHADPILKSNGLAAIV